jgi:RNA polymerase sigma-70 factor (ECF subfamily)
MPAPEDRRIELEKLLAHLPFVNGLARRLAEDEHDGADVAQDTWLAALTRPPGSDAALRSWFGTIARNALFQAARSRGRRQRREHAAAQDDHVGSAADAADRNLERRRVAEAVLALPEAHREVLLLRFYDSLGPTEIAARLGMPMETVRTRIRRALAALRAQLARPSAR